MRRRSPKRWSRKDSAVYKTPDEIWARMDALSKQMSNLSSGSRDHNQLEEIAQEMLYFSELMERKGEYRYIEIGDEYIRVLRVCLTGRFTRIPHLTRLLYPNEFPMASQDRMTILCNRFYRVRFRALTEIPRVLNNPDLEATLPESERDFYSWLREEFGPRPLQEVTKRLNKIGDGPSQTAERGTDFILGHSRLVVLAAALFEDYETELETCRHLWPQEFDTQDSNSLVSRFSHNKSRGLEVMARVLGLETFYDLGLAVEEVRFYERVIGKFGAEKTMDKVIEKANSHSSMFAHSGGRPIRSKSKSG